MNDIFLLITVYWTITRVNGEVFWKSGQIEIHFALSQASSGTSLDYPQGAFWRQ